METADAASASEGTNAELANALGDGGSRYQSDESETPPDRNSDPLAPAPAGTATAASTAGAGDASETAPGSIDTVLTADLKRRDGIDIDQAPDSDDSAAETDLFADPPSDSVGSTGTPASSASDAPPATDVRDAVESRSTNGASGSESSLADSTRKIADIDEATSEWLWGADDD
jgi:hypothetical protein